jgi:hypothetical protein
MRLTTLATAAFLSTSAAAPTPQFDIGALLGGLGGAGGAGGAGGLGGLGGLLGGLGGSGPTVDAAPILKTYDTLKTQVDKLNEVILKFSNATNPDAALKDYLAAGKDTIKAYKDNAAALTALNGTVSIISALGFPTPRAALTTSVETAVNNLISKKDVIASAKGTAQVLASLKDEKSAASAFSAAVIAKLPDIAQGIAAPTAQKVFETFDKAIAAFT